MRIPKAGEYWYIYAKNRTVFAKIMAVNDTTIVAYIPKFDGTISYKVSICDEDVKWEPNWFWKLLGYV